MSMQKEFDHIGEAMKHEWENDAYNQDVWELMIRVPEDLEGCLRGLEETAQAGSTLAAICLADILFIGQHGASRDVAEAIRWARYAAQQGSIEGGFQLAEYLEEVQDLKEAEKEYIKVAMRGYSPAMYRLARKYWSGRFSPKRKDESTWYFQEAIRSGHLFARADFAKLKRAGNFGFWGRLEGILDFFLLIIPMAMMWYRYPAGDLLRR